MATTPVASQLQGSADLLDECSNDCGTDEKLGAAGGQSPLQPDKEAPRAEPEDDLDVLESGSADKPPTDSLQDSGTKLANSLNTEELESATLSHNPPREIGEEETELEQGLEAENELEMSDYIAEEPHPSCVACTSPTEDSPEMEIMPSTEKELTDLNDKEASPEPTEDLTSSDSNNSQEEPPASHPSDPADSNHELNELKEIGSDLELVANALENNASELDLTGGAEELILHAAPETSAGDSSEDVFTTDSPPFADEGDDPDEGSMDSKPVEVSLVQGQCGPNDNSGNKSPLSSSRSSSTSGQSEPVIVDSTPPSDQQQGEQLCQNQPDHVPGEQKQEAAQQVFSQHSPPLMTVATEAANQDEAGPEPSSCTVAVRANNDGAGERREGESRQTGGEEGQKVSGLVTGEVVEEQHIGIVQLQEESVETPGTPSESNAASRMENDTHDDSDSGVSTDFSPSSTMEISTVAIPESPTPPANETPIEREIRRAIEREHSLRRSRGLQTPPTNPEYVEVPLRKSVLSKSLPAKCDKSQSKDRELAGKMMQSEILAESLREQDMVRLGRVPGIYDKGTVRQLKEKKRIFEAFQIPKDLSSHLSPQSKASSWASASDLSTQQNQGNDSVTTSSLGGSSRERTRSTDLVSQKQDQTPTSTSSISSPRGPRLSEGLDCQVVILENNFDLPASTLNPTHSHTVVDSGSPYASSTRIGQSEEESEEEMLVPKDNPFFKLRSSMALDKVEQDIREAREREKELRRQRSSLYGGTLSGGGEGGGRGVGPEGIRNRLESTELQRPPPLNGLSTPDLPATPTRIEGGTPAARQAQGKLAIWPPAQDKQVAQSPRSPRQKTPLLQRWEQGLVNGHGGEED